MSSGMEVDGSWYAGEVAKVNRTSPSPSLKRSFSEYANDLSTLSDLPVPQATMEEPRVSSGFITSLFSCIARIFGRIFGAPTAIIAVSTDATGRKRRAVDGGSPQATPKHLPGAYPEPSLIITPPDSRPGSAQADRDMARDEAANATTTTTSQPPAPTAPTPRTTSAATADPEVVKPPRWVRPIRPRHKWRPYCLPEPEKPKVVQDKPADLPTEALPQLHSVTPVRSPTSRGQKKAQVDAERDANVVALVQRAKHVLTDSPEVAAIKQIERIAYELRQEARAAEAKKAEEEAAARRLAIEKEALAAEEKAAKEAEAARLKVIAEKEAVRQAREAEEAANQLLAEQEAQDQLEAEAAELDLQRQTLIRPLDPKWDDKVKAVMESTNDRATIVKTVDGVELKRPDFGSLLPKPGQSKANGWLNDEIVNGFYASVVADKKEQTGWKKGMVPAFESYNTGWFTTYKKKGIDGIKTWSRRKGIKGDKLLEAEKVFFPINTGSHWMLMVISPKARTIEYLDSLHNSARRFFAIAREFLEMELGNKYVAADWKELHTQSSMQDNSDDCGAFTCLNGLAAAKGYGFDNVQAKQMQDGRRMIGAILLNGGFHGDWKL